LINQDIPKEDYEIIVMDDGSTDDSVNIVKNYITKNSNIILHKELNVGLYATRNKLLKLAQGEYIYNIDADDYITHHSINYLLETSINNDLDLICFETKETSSFQCTTIPINLNNVKSNLCTGLNYIKKNRNLRFEVWWFFIKRNYLDTINLVFSNNQYNADVLFTLELLCNAKRVQHIPVSIHRYVQTPGSIMRSDDFEIRAKRIDYMYSMILDFSKLINYLSIKNFENKEIILQNLKFRRDKFTFFTFIKMIKYRFKSRLINEKINLLKENRAYPLTHFIGKEYNSIFWRILIRIFNNEFFLFRLIGLYNNLSFNQTKYDK
jgi:glycosyltransferase involved in cell wall biosynthesis